MIHQSSKLCMSRYKAYKLLRCLKLKLWPNGVANRRKFSTCVYLRLRLVRPCVHLRWLAMTCAHFGRDLVCAQADASFSPFGHPTQVSASWVTHVNLLSANEKWLQSALKWVFCDFCVLARKLASPFGHPTQVSTQVQLVATCDYLRVRLARALWVKSSLLQNGLVFIS